MSSSRSPLTPRPHDMAPTSSNSRRPASISAPQDVRVPCRPPTSAPLVTPDTRSTSIPFTFRRPFQPKLSSTSLEPSTAEGKPIPVDDSTAENRTSALRHLNKTNPSRHRYAKSTGAKSSTYSEPVIVRSYYSPQPSSRNPSASRGGIVVTNRRAPPHPQAAVPTTSLSRSMPFASKAALARDGVLNSVAKVTGKKRWGAEPTEEAKLPPIEAFTFRSFLDNMEAQPGSSDINADLDRIAEICARSRYSLSNQYEVHYAPHGSGSSFLRTSSSEPDSHGPTLQVVSLEEEHSTRSKRRRHGGRRNSRAMGTLETIMSSSRSSDEDKSHKKPAADIAAEVRGRVTRQSSGSSSPISHTESTDSEVDSHDGHSSPSKGRHGRSSSLALIDGSRQSFSAADTTSPRASSQLEIRTAPDNPSDELSKDNHAALTERLHRPLASGGLAPAVDDRPGEGLLATLSNWMPWTSAAGSKGAGRAEGSLRDLLKIADTKGKGVEGHA
ncbi:hypothetical protein NLU13_9723 [Sarocladium strictum]|uniref:Uncharacterized protein n=1 Tax=Sarocladium strictum TaxID=5046 RepID=A0AA39GAM3_SARSR|nr:hypothetical protein NLU13_9723 [Sarocladium strictum]